MSNYTIQFKRSLMTAADIYASRQDDHRYRLDFDRRALGAHLLLSELGLDSGFMLKDALLGKKERFMSLDELASKLQRIGAVRSKSEGKELLSGIHKEATEKQAPFKIKYSYRPLLPRLGHSCPPALIYACSDFIPHVDRSLSFAPSTEDEGELAFIISDVALLRLSFEGNGYYN